MSAEPKWRLVMAASDGVGDLYKYEVSGTVHARIEFWPADPARSWSKATIILDGFNRSSSETWFKFEGHVTDLEQAKKLAEALLAVSF